MQSDSVEKFLIGSPGDPSKGINPKIDSYFEDSEQTDVMFPPGYYSRYEQDDEVIILNAFNDGNQRVIAGQVLPFKVDINLGDRFLYTDNVQIFLRKSGEVQIFSNNKKITLDNGAGSIVINENGIINLN